MSRITDVYSDLLNLTGNSEYSYNEEDKSGYSQETRIKRDGDIPMCFTEIKKAYANYRFFVFYMPELHDTSRKVNFLTYHWKDDPNIRRYVKVSGNSENSITICAEERVGEGYECKRKLVMSKGKRYAEEKNDEGEVVKKVNIDEIRSALQDKDIDIFFIGFSPMITPRRKAKLVH